MPLPAPIGSITLALYALLLAGGGFMGMLKGKSRASLIAGVVSATLALFCLLVAELGGRPALGLGLGLALALGLLVFFTRRFTATKRFVPGGLMALVSLLVVVILAAMLVRGVGPGA